MTRCRESAASEPLAGTAPLARWWWLIEMPGPWGRKALEECRVPAVRSLDSSDERRVLLVRRRGRHPAADPHAPLRVWFAGALPGDPPPRMAVVEDHDELLRWPAPGPAADRAVEDPRAPRLVVCANSARDLCCGLDGRALVQDLDDDDIWECSHLGGHRFAPTALLVGTGLVYGRLDARAARTLLDRGATAETAGYLRGRSALSPPAQAAEAWLMAQGIQAQGIQAQGIQPDPAEVQVAQVDDGLTRVTFAGAPAIDLRHAPGAAPRPASCGAEPEEWSAWRVETAG